MKNTKAPAAPLIFVSPNIRHVEGGTTMNKSRTPEDVAKSHPQAIATRRQEFAAA